MLGVLFVFVIVTALPFPSAVPSATTVYTVPSDATLGTCDGGGSTNGRRTGRSYRRGGGGPHVGCWVCKNRVKEGRT